MPRAAIRRLTDRPYNTLKQAKLEERTLNVYENKGPGSKRRRRPQQLAEPVGAPLVGTQVGHKGRPYNTRKQGKLEERTLNVYENKG